MWVRFFNQLSIRNKFIIIGIMLLSNVIFLGFSVVQSNHANWKQTKDELSGSQTMERTFRIVQWTQEQRGMSGLWLKNIETSFATLEEKDLKIQSLVQEAITNDKDGFLDATKMRELEKERKILLEEVKLKKIPPKESFERFTKIINAMILVHQSVSDQSSVILDPAAPSYHIAYALTVGLPRMTESLGQLRAKGAQLIATENEEEIKELREIMASNQMQWSVFLQETVSTLEKSSKDLNGELNKNIETIHKVNQEISELLEKAKNKSIEPKVYFNEMTRLINVMYDDVVVEDQKKFESLLNERLDGLQSMFAQQIVFCLVSIIISITMIEAARASMSKSIRFLQKTAHQLSEGKLNMDIREEGRDELAQTQMRFKEMLIQLKGIIAAAKETSSLLKNGAETNEIASQKGLSESSQQWKLAQKLMAEMKLMEDEVTEQEKLANETQKLISGALERAINGRKSFEASLFSNEKAREELLMIEAQVRQLEEASKGAREAAEAIEKIAIQTNMLALNAAIEAARAGDAGRGFAVVADEVKTLATNSSESAQKVGEILRLTSSNTKKVVELVQQRVEKNQEEIERSKKAASDLEECEGVCQKANHEAGKMAEISQNQSKKIKEMKLDCEKTSENAMSAKEAAANSEEISKENKIKANELSQKLERFIID